MSFPAPQLTARARVERLVLRGLASLPPALQLRLSGSPPVQVDGEVLAPEVQLTLSLLNRRGGRTLEEATAAEAREERRRMAAVYAGRPVAVGGVEDVQIGGAHKLRARHYSPIEPDGPRPLLVYFHGGGFTYGDLDTHDGVCRMLCNHAGVHVLAVDYRLAPEHPFPAAVEDARGALAWAFEHAPALKADGERIAVGGDSAGGNLAAVVAQLAARDGGPAPALQLLIYPVTDLSRRRRSRELFGEGFLLTNADIDWFERNYLGDEQAHRRDPRASPLLAEDLSGLAPAVVATAAFDPLRDEGEEYAHALRAAGTPVLLRRYPGFIHAFVSAAGVSRACRDALIEIAGATRALLAVSPSATPRAGIARVGANTYAD